jgi:hypothetical protein
MADGRSRSEELASRRDQVITTLSQAFVEGALDVDELDRRLDLAHQADTVDALAALTSDLSTSSSSLASGSPSVALVHARPHSGRALAVLGSVERRGAWAVARHQRIVTCLGSGVFDFREVQLPPGETEVRVLAVLGSVEILVPPDLALECEGTVVLGTFEGRDRAPVLPDAGRPMLKIHGLSVLGSVEVKTRLPGETGRQARRRRRREQRALPQTPRALPPGSE